MPFALSLSKGASGLVSVEAGLQTRLRRAIIRNAMEAQVLKREFSVDEFHRMADAGVFEEDDRLELLDGEIVRMTPIGSRHAGCVDRLSDLFWERCRGVAIVHVQNPLVLSGHTEFYPDIALLKRRPDFYSQSLPQPGDVLFVVEVVDTTGNYDRRIKVPRYARAGVPEVWIVDLRDRAIDVSREPAGDEYREQRRVGPGESLVIPRAPTSGSPSTKCWGETAHCPLSTGL